MKNFLLYIVSFTVTVLFLKYGYDGYWNSKTFWVILAFVPVVNVVLASSLTLIWLAILLFNIIKLVLDWVNV